MRVLKLALVSGLIYATAVLAGCAHGKMGKVEQEIDRAAITKTTPIFVETIAAKTATFAGDNADDAGKCEAERRTIEASYAILIANELKKQGYNAQATTTPAKSGVVLTGAVTKIDHGSGAARMMWGMGAGSSNLFTNLTIEDRTAKKTLGKFEVIATSGGRGGWSAAGSFMDAHLNDGAEKVAEYVSGNKK